MAKPRLWVPSDNDVLPFQLQPFVRAQSDIADLQSQAKIDWSYPQAKLDHSAIQWSNCTVHAPARLRLVRSGHRSWPIYLRDFPRLNGYQRLRRTCAVLRHHSAFEYGVLWSVHAIHDFGQHGTSLLCYGAISALCERTCSSHYCYIRSLCYNSDGAACDESKIHLIEKLMAKHRINGQCGDHTSTSEEYHEHGCNYERMLERDARARISELGDRVQIRAMEVRLRWDLYAG